MATLVVNLYSEAFSEFETGDAPVRKTNPKYSPTTATITALGLYDVERKHGAVYVVSKDSLDVSTGDWFCKARTEKELLEDFWEGAPSYDTFVTFNGRAYALPFLLLRSAANSVRPSSEIARQRYLTKQKMPYHVDLMEELTFYGATSKETLGQFCKALDIEKPETDKALTSKLPAGYKKLTTDMIGETLQIYELYEKWKIHVAPISFINKVEF